MWWTFISSLCFMLSCIDAYPVLFDQLEKTKGHYLGGQIDDDMEPSLRSEEDTCGSRIDYNQDGTANIDIHSDKFHVDQASQGDFYMCTTHKVPYNATESFITKFVPRVSMASVHHMVVYGCSKPKVVEKKMWSCLTHLDLCDVGLMEILYAWARGAPSLTLPSQVGYKVGGRSGIKYLVVQIHYVSNPPPGSIGCPGVTMVATQRTQKYFAGVIITGPDFISIPPYSSYTKSDVSCSSPSSSPINIFAFRTHTHGLGTVVTGYRVHNGSVVMIGKGNPQWPQAFYPRIGGPITVLPGDGLLVRCLYKSNRPRITRPGLGGSDEMCNFFMMYSSASPPAPQLICFRDHLASSDQLFPPTANDLTPYPGYAGQASTIAIATGVAVQPEVPETQPSSPRTSRLSSRAVDSRPPELAADLKWQVSPCIGDVGGVAVDQLGHLHVFHRSYRKWNNDSFLPSSNIFASPHRPITNNTVAVIDSRDGAVVHTWGANMFYMPHGAAIAGNDTLWLTDVALHQVFKFPLYGGVTPLLTLGVKMEPGDDEEHFCKPTDVAVDWEGSVYVADGYCNSRIVKFTPDGRFVKTWGERTEMHLLPPFHFNIVHSIAMVGSDEVCVADREHGRIVCFTLDGELRRVIEHQAVMGRNVYAIAYSALYGGVIYAVNGAPGFSSKTSGFTIDSKTGAVIQQWNPSSSVDLTKPHDVAVSPDGTQVYVGQLSERKVYKFEVITSGGKPL